MSRAWRIRLRTCQAAELDMQCCRTMVENAAPMDQARLAYATQLSRKHIAASHHTQNSAWIEPPCCAVQRDEHGERWQKTR